MDEGFQRLFARPGPQEPAPQVLSLNVQAALGPVRTPKRSQFSWLMRHFFERFFNHETASPDGDAKTRMVQIACATGLPPFIVAIYLWPIYHPIAGWPPGQPHSGEPPAYWLQVNHHLFFVMYSFVALGIATVFEWDLFFPDLLDLFILGPQPIAPLRSFAARVASIAIFVAAFLFDANVLAAFVLPMAMDPPNLPRFLAGHMLAVAASGLFAAIFILALNGTLLSLLGEQLFRRIALLLQCLAITSLVMLMLFFPVISGVVPVLLQSGGAFARCFPPFWFLGIYQCLLDSPSALPIYNTLAQTAVAATLAAASLAVLTYPLAYLRKTRQLVEGPGTFQTSIRLFRPLNFLLHRTILRKPLRRAVFHFINQTLPRVPRYRIYLVLYGGVGLSVVVASILRIDAIHQHIRIAVSADGVRVALAIVVFWVIAGLRMAFVSSGNQRGRWIFRIIHGNPSHFHAALEQSSGTRMWVLLWTGLLTPTAFVALRLISPPELLTPTATTSQALVAAGMCLLLTDAFFLHVTAIPFTGESSREQPNLALTVLKYFTFFPLIAALPLRLEPWIETGARHLIIAVIAFATAHLFLLRRHRNIVREHSSQLPLEDDEEDFPMKLGLRY